jgi:exosortase
MTRQYFAVILLGLSWLLLAFGHISNTPWFAYVSLIVLITSGFLVISRYWRVPYLVGIWLLPWLVVPLPFNRDERLITFLQRVSSQISSVALDWLNVPHLMEGNTLILADRQFFVDEACSGIVSLMSIIACAVIYGVWRSRGPFHLFLLTLVGIGLATLMNVVRITVIAVAYFRAGVDWSEGTPHEILGLLIFLATFIALVSTDYALIALLAPVKSEGRLGGPITYGARLVEAWDWLHAWGQSFVLAADGAPMSQGHVEHASPLRVVSTPFLKPTSKSVEPDLQRGSMRFAIALIPILAFATLAVGQFTLAGLFQTARAANPQSLARARTLGADVLPKELGTASFVNFSAADRSADDSHADRDRSR